MRKVLTYGTFDMPHYGHINLLKQAHNLGNCLIVGLSTDEFNKCKGKVSFFNYEKRKALLESIRYVDRVIPESSWDQKVENIKLLEIDVFAIGDDWEGKFDFLKEWTEVVYIPRTPEISTSDIKNRLNNNNLSY